jgi:hypothetical protein
MRRVHLRSHENILKRVLLQAGAFNLGLLMRQLVGVGTPRSFQGRGIVLLGCLWAFLPCPARLWDTIWTLYHPFTSLGHLGACREDRRIAFPIATTCPTGC